MVHGDDFIAVGQAGELKDTEELLGKHYKIKTEMLGSDSKDAKEVRVLNKIIRITSEGLELEADPRHAELVVHDLGLAEAKATRTPGIKESSKKPVIEEKSLDTFAHGDQRFLAHKDDTFAHGD